MKRPDEHEAALVEASADDYALAGAADRLLKDYASLVVELETLRASVDVAAVYIGCGDNSCLFETPSGMATNGGCRCERRPGFRPAMAKLYRATKAAAGKVPT